MGNKTHELVLKNSIVYDVKNKIDGEKKDILISSGKIVDSLKNEQKAEVVDASGCITFPGFIDVRSHVFAQETMYHHLLSQSHNTRFDYSNVLDIERAALAKGFTFLCEMDVPITQSKIALHNMQLSSLLDHGMIMDMGSNWSFLGSLESESAIEDISNILSLLMGLVKGLGISTNCPYHQQYWKLEKIPNKSNIPMIPINAVQIYDLLTKAASNNNIKPHFLSPYDKEDSSINHMDVLNGMDITNFTLSTANQFFSKDFTEFVKFHASHEEFTTEITPFSVGNTYPLITRDRNLALRESKNSGIPITTVDFEFDTEYYVTGRKIDKNHPYLSHWIQLIKELKTNSDLTRVILSSNAPYHMGISDWSTHISDLINSQNSFSLLDVSALLSCNPARVLNLGLRKGHLGLGADADVICFHADSEKLDENAFSDTKFVIKDGKLIKKNYEIIKPKRAVGGIFWKNGKYKISEMNKIKKRLENFYDKRFSMHLSALENKEFPSMEKL